MKAASWPLLGACFGAASCLPELTDESWLIDSPRVIAVTSEPAEAKPGTEVQLSAVVALPRGVRTTKVPRWRVCSAPKPPTEDNAVSTDCLKDAALVEVARAATIATPMPFDACSRFGPSSPPGGFRPRDPDATGGYYQPFRLDLDGDGTAPVFHLQRVTCPLASASFAVATEFAQTYRANRSPHLGDVHFAESGQLLQELRAKAGTTLSVEVSVSVSQAETYAFYDAPTERIVKRTEVLRISWFVDGGTLDTSASVLSAADLDVPVTNRWTLPRTKGACRLWTILRDSRGGTEVRAEEVDVFP